MKTFDADDISSSVDKVVEICQQLEEERSYKIALVALSTLSCMKLIIGQERFDNLPAFSRWLKIADDIVNDEMKKEAKNED